MPRGQLKAKPPIPDRYGVSKEKLDDTDVLCVMKALEGVKSKVSDIAGALHMKHDTITTIKGLHRNNHDLLAISLMDKWLRGNYMRDKPPYSLHEEQYQHPSWWNLVWAVERNVGGNNPAHAETIAENYKDYENPKVSSDFDSAPPTDLDASDVTSTLETVWHKWYEIGVALKRPTDKLDAIFGKKDSVKNSFNEMIESWLQADHAEKEKPCWKLLLIAVAAPYGGQNPAFAEYVFKGLTSSGIAGDDASASNSPPKKKSKIAEDGFFGDVSQKIKDRFLPYTINKKEREKHGLALVIVNTTFKSNPEHLDIDPLPSRDCASLDRERLETLLSSLRYRVRIEENLTAEEIESLLDKVRVQGDPDKTVQPADDSFVCCISSHGGWDPKLGTDVVFGVTGAEVKKDGDVTLKGAVDIKVNAYKALSPLRDGCPMLNDKPKMFFIQACRGSEYGVIADDGIGSKKKQQRKPARRLPRESDFLFAYATAPGKKAYRNDGPDDATTQQIDFDGRAFGSFFISSLCANLTDYASKLPLIPILELVSQDLAAEEKNIYKLKTEEEGTVTTRQSPNFSSSLRGPVFFFNEARKRYKSRMLSDL